MDVLDVGCGDAKVEGAIGLDCCELPGVDIVHDLTNYPWPIEDNKFDKVYLNNLIEHLPDTIKVMEEVHRVLKPGGEVIISVVYWNHKHSISDPQHVSFFNEVTWEFFTGDRKEYYTSARFEMKKFEYIYDPEAKKTFKSKRLMNFLSKYLCNIKQGMNVVMAKK